jgi:hypothetical protein
MAHYQVSTIKRPDNWQPETADDVPLEFQGPVSVLAESDDVFEAVSRAVAYNESDAARREGRWAVVVEPSANGRLWPAARLCTPLTYKVMVIWWPDGWEPESPLDVPNCAFQTQGQGGGEPLDYPRAEAIVSALNRQCMDRPGATWHVIVAVENEAVSRIVSYDPAGIETTSEVRRMHVIRPRQGARGDCTHCPAHRMECAAADWRSQSQQLRAKGAAL